MKSQLRFGCRIFPLPANPLRRGLVAAAFVPNGLASDSRYHSLQLLQRPNRDEMDYGDLLARFQLQAISNIAGYDDLILRGYRNCRQ